MGSISAMSALILTFINPNITAFGSKELNIMFIGISFGVLSLFFGQMVEKYFPTSNLEKEIRGSVSMSSW